MMHIGLYRQPVDIGLCMYNDGYKPISSACWYRSLYINTMMHIGLYLQPVAIGLDMYNLGLYHHSVGLN